MLERYVRVAAATPKIKVADCEFNAEKILELIKAAVEQDIKILCLPELCLTGYTCNDLFLQPKLIKMAEEALSFILMQSKAYKVLTILGLPLKNNDKLFNVAAVFFGGEVLGFVPKSHLPNYTEFNELRYFSAALPENSAKDFNGNTVPFGTKLIFQCQENTELKLAVEICEDLWVPFAPSAFHAAAGANIIANLSASNETVGKANFRRRLVSAQSSKLMCGYIYSCAGEGESTTDLTFPGHNLICENGKILAETKPFKQTIAVSEIDISYLIRDRMRINTFGGQMAIKQQYNIIPFKLETTPSRLLRKIDPQPFIPENKSEREERSQEILNIQISSLAKRLEYTGFQSIVLGVSGGLDSSLALIISVLTFAKLGLPASGILAVTMPCFGTTERTKNNAQRLSEALGVSFKKIDITKTVSLHLQDINHEKDDHSVVFENAQARIRTLTLMDLANKFGGMVIGTNDLSEIALGWSTFGGDHMSMYCVNAGVPKTLVQHIIKYLAKKIPNVSTILQDVLATPISPELLPPDSDAIVQKTENLLGPYELHDFFLYHFIRHGHSPADIYQLANLAFKGRYTPDVILKYLRVFFSRFFAMQFKRNCFPDGPKIGAVNLSPRGDFRMPSDAVCKAWLAELDKIAKG